MEKGYIYSEIEHAGKELYKQYLGAMVKYDFDVEKMDKELGFHQTEDFLLNLIDVAPKFIRPYEDLCTLYSKRKDGEDGLAAAKASGFVISKSLVVDKLGDFPEVLKWSVIENRPIIRFILRGAEELWQEGRLGEAKQLYVGLLRSNWSDNVGVRYNLLAIHQGMTYRDYNKRFVLEGALSDDIDAWFAKGYQEVQLLVKWIENVGEMN